MKSLLTKGRGYILVVIRGGGFSPRSGFVHGRIFRSLRAQKMRRLFSRLAPNNLTAEHKNKTGDKMAKCHIFNSRKGKGKCLIKDGLICSLCCGNTRTEEPCSECVFYQKPKR